MPLGKPKYSPFSKEFYIHYKGMCEDEAIKEAKSKRPCNKEYWIRKGFSEEDASIKVREHQLKSNSKFIDNNKLGLYKDRTSTQIGYWLKRGFSEEESKKKVSERQVTFSKEKLIEKYGIDKGVKIWKERQDKWINTLAKKSKEETEIINKNKAITLDRMIELYGRDIGEKKYESWLTSITTSHGFASKESVLIFTEVYNLLKDCISYDDVYFLHDGKKEFFIYYDNDIYFYDFCIRSKKIIVEYHGEKFHPNKDKMNESEWAAWRQLRSGKTAEVVYNRDVLKKNIAISEGFKFLEVFSSENDIVNKITNFIRNNI